MTAIEKRHKIIELLFQVEDMVVLDQIQVLIAQSKAEVADPIEFTEEQFESVQRGLADLKAGRVVSMGDFQKEKESWLAEWAKKAQ